MRSFVLSDARANDYPGIFQEISAMIGIEATAKLVAEYGGTRLYIASNLNPDKKLFKLLGQEVAQKLAGEFGGLRPEIPRALKARAYQRNEKIRADRAAGMKVPELARKYELTERTIRRISNSTRLYIASNLNPDKKLFKLLGQEVAQELAGEFGGLRPEIPRALKARAYQRNEKIRADRAAGMKVPELARKYELTERTIRTISNSTRT